MKVQVIRTTIDRKTGKTLSKQVIEEKEMDENEYFRPLVQVFGDRILKELSGIKNEIC